MGLLVIALTKTSIKLAALVGFCHYIVKQKKGTNFLLCASLLILDINW